MPSEDHHHPRGCHNVGQLQLGRSVRLFL
jgi:hypothetical protein